MTSTVEFQSRSRGDLRPHRQTDHVPSGGGLMRRRFRLPCVGVALLCWSCAQTEETPLTPIAAPIAAPTQTPLPPSPTPVPPVASPEPTPVPTRPVPALPQSTSEPTAAPTAAPPPATAAPVPTATPVPHVLTAGTCRGPVP